MPGKKVGEKADMSTNFWELLHQRQDELTKSGRMVADYLIHHADEAQYLSISSLARECKVAEATVFRFCRALGFEGYHEMRIALAQANATASLINQQEPEPGTTTDKLCEHASALFITAINGTQSALSPDAVDKAVDLLRAARQVFCLGQGGSMLLANDICARFSSLSNKFRTAGDSHLQLLSASLMTPEDVVLFVSYSGATRDMMETLRTAKASGAKIVLLTHYEDSPGAALADVVLLCGAQELGTTIFDAENGVMTLRFDKPTLRKLWDNYYVPYIKGWCSASGKFRSDDIKIGSLLAYVGSSSSASFFPTQVLTSDTESHGIEMAALPCPSFAGCEPVAVQQGAGMVVIPGTEDEISACVAFLKWFTQPENNLQFSVQSGYMPVTYAANSISALENSGLTVSESIRKVLSLSIDTVDRSKLYTTHAFPDALRARNTLQYALEDRVTADRATVLERLAAGQTPEEAEAETVLAASVHTL